MDSREGFGGGYAVRFWWAPRRHSLVYWVSDSGVYPERSDEALSVMVVSTWWSAAGLVWGGKCRMAVSLPALKLADDARAALARAVEGRDDA